MQEFSFAARFRVTYREASSTGGLAAVAASRRLDALRLDSEVLARGGRWREWYMHSYYHNLAASRQYGLQLGISINSIEDDLGANTPRPHTKAQSKRLQQGVQRAARASLGRVLRVDPEARLRKKLERWRLPLFPRIRAMRAARVMGRLRSLVPPRVLAAVLRTWFNGWCTLRRFHGRGDCLFGCTCGEDSIDHYMRCARLHAYGQSRLRLARADNPLQLSLNFMLLAPTSAITDEVLSRRALLMAAAYRLHCRHRHTGSLTDEGILSRALDQAVKEATLGHQVAMRHLDGIWIRATTSSSTSSR